jgi:hypothetical protein
MTQIMLPARAGVFGGVTYYEAQHGLMRDPGPQLFVDLFRNLGLMYWGPC